MARSERRHAVRRWLALLLVLLVAGGALATWRLDLADHFRTPPPDPVTEPEQVPPPTGLVLPSPGTVRPVATPLTGDGDLSRAKVRRALGTRLRDPDLGRSFAVLVTDLSGRTVLESGPERVIPASTTKLLTTAAALEVLGPDHTFTTRVVAGADPGQVVLVGGGDPYLASRPPRADDDVWPPRTDIRTLARLTAEALRTSGRMRVRVAYDDSLFSGPPGAATWEPDYLADDIVSPISALWVDGGRARNGWGRVDDPPEHAARVFARALTRSGIAVRGAPAETVAHPEAATLAEVSSPPVAQIAQRINEVSDNEAAEVLAHHVGLATLGEGSFDAGARGTLETLRGLGVPVDGDLLHDGSGLSRANRLAPATIAAVLRVAAEPERPELNPVLTGLPVAGFSGSLRYRFQEAPPTALGVVRAKTGSLTGVTSLAGLVTDLDGNVMVFVMAADRVRHDRPGAGDPRVVVDDLVGALATCHCSR